MKKLILLLLCVSTIATAQTTNKSTSGSLIQGEDAGYSLENSPNTKWVLNSVKALEALDTTAYKSYYATDVKFHDNQEQKNIAQNIAFLMSLKSNGIAVKFERVAPIWEYVHKTKKMNSTDYYVISYQNAVLTKGDKIVKVIINAVDLIKDGKIKEEWLVYDTAGILSLFK
jgi:hypothetical protein